MGKSVTSLARRGREIDFALIGHQESWRAAADVLAVLRGPQHPPLPDDEIKDILPWIPPRAVCHVDVGSIAGAKAHGVYIDSFIPPDRLEAAYMHDNIARVRGAAAYAIQAGAKIVSLGGFSSILIEGNFDQLPERQDTVFTTGNTLTVGFIVQGIRKMCALEGRNLRRSTLLIVGATGDVGSGCARCLAPYVKRVLLSARNLERLRKLAAELEADGVQVEIATAQQHFSAEADVVICAASLASASLLLGRIAPGAIVCDAGYPKNLSPNAQMPDARIFFGGLGQITGGMSFTPDFHGVLNRHPFPDVVHGCLLEGMALALEGRFEPFSQGRGFITPQRVEEIETIAARHGIYLAPLYNAEGPLEDALDREAEYSIPHDREPTGTPAGWADSRRDLILGRRGNGSLRGARIDGKRRGRGVATYSVRSAFTGSIEAARCAGIMLANRAHTAKRDNRPPKNERIPAPNLVKLSRDQVGASDRNWNADEQSDEHLQKRPTQNQSNHVAPVRAQRHPHANLAGPARDGISRHAVQSHGSQNERQNPEESGHLRHGALLIEPVRHLLIHRLDAQDGQVGIHIREDAADLRLHALHAATQL